METFKNKDEKEECLVELLEIQKTIPPFRADLHSEIKSAIDFAARFGWKPKNIAKLRSAAFSYAIAESEDGRQEENDSDTFSQLKVA